MSKLKTTNISHPNSAANDIVLDANGSVNVDSGTFYVDATNNRVGIGTTTVSAKLHIAGATGGGVAGIWDTAAGGARIEYKDNGTRRGYLNWDTNSLYLAADSGNSIKFSTNAGVTQHATIDSSGRLLVGTSSTTWPHKIVTEGGIGFSAGSLAITRAQAGSSIASGADVGYLTFGGNDNTTFAVISAWADGTPGSNDYPGRLVFSTTADGASSPTEAMRIDSIGSVMIGTTSVAVGVGNTLNGVGIAADGYVAMSRSSGPAAYINRNTTDGTIVSLRQAGTEEGTISVSGTTVSYNGAHLSRWSQLPNGAERTEILRGSVLSNIDEMCEWGEEENEQLNRMKVSDVEGDKNVSGVFQAWDDDDDTYTNDFYCAMTGDFIIRIGAGVIVERGDLLMSAGDGTAKPQDDDIIRSKTIAKVTSTNVSCTYDDGSYCVPCVLMAC